MHVCPSWILEEYKIEKDHHYDDLYTRFAPIYFGCQYVLIVLVIITPFDDEAIIIFRTQYKSQHVLGCLPL